MRAIPLFSPATTKLSWFRNKLQVWINPGYGIKFHRHWYQAYDRIILRAGKLIICWTKVWD